MPPSIFSSPRVSLLPNSFAPKLIVLPNPDSLNDSEAVVASPFSPPVNPCPIFANRPDNPFRGLFISFSNFDLLFCSSSAWSI